MRHYSRKKDRIELINFRYKKGFIHMLNATKTHDWLRYWRNSLADADSGKGILKKEDLSLHLSIDEDAAYHQEQA